MLPVKRIVLCSGKVFYDLEAARTKPPHPALRLPSVAVVRLEQFYPFPAAELAEIFASYPNANEIVWTQEEPQNMGGWTFVENRIRNIMPTGSTLRFVGREPSASPATGSYAIHELEQKQLVDAALKTDTDEISPASEPEVSEKLAPASA